MIYISNKLSKYWKQGEGAGEIGAIIQIFTVQGYIKNLQSPVKVFVETIGICF
jgi:hypothetical protein